jgi:hypothetical protein
LPVSLESRHLAHDDGLDRDHGILSLTTVVSIYAGVNPAH